MQHCRSTVVPFAALPSPAARSSHQTSSHCVGGSPSVRGVHVVTGSKIILSINATRLKRGQRRPWRVDVPWSDAVPLDGLMSSLGPGPARARDCTTPGGRVVKPGPLMPGCRHPPRVGLPLLSCTGTVPYPPNSRDPPPCPATLISHRH